MVILAITTTLNMIIRIQLTVETSLKMTLRATRTTVLQFAQYPLSFSMELDPKRDSSRSGPGKRNGTWQHQESAIWCQ